MITLAPAQVDAWRLARHHLLERAPRDRLVDVVTDMCGVQAQVMSAAEMSVWARVADVRPADVQAALWDDRSLVKTWMMRGTLHLLAARDLPLYAAAGGLKREYRRDSWLRWYGVTLEQMEAIVEGIGAVLDGRFLTREEVADAVGGRVGVELREKMLESWGTLLKPAAFNGTLCFAPSRGRNVVFTGPRSWLAWWEEHAGDEALRAVLRRFVHAYGPVTSQEFGLWWGGPAGAPRLFRSIAAELVEVNVEGRSAWMLAADAALAQELGPPDSVRLLPNFDVYTLAYRPRSIFVPEGVYERVYRVAGWISPVVLVDGRVAGVWEREARRGRIEVSVEAFVRLSKVQRRAVEEEAERLGAFLEAPVGVVWLAPSARS